MLYRLVRCARRVASGCKQDNAREQSDRRCAEFQHNHNHDYLIHLLKVALNRRGSSGYKAHSASYDFLS
jgi:hypothetical protein